jgi:hypothetical protein
MLLLALNEAWTSTVVSILIWVILFPAFVTGLIVFAVIVARGEGTENEENRRYPRL